VFLDRIQAQKLAWLARSQFVKYFCCDCHSAKRYDNNFTAQAEGRKVIFQDGRCDRFREERKAGG
jgi:hypothetical protein